MLRIILHWSAGTHTPSALDLSHYHYVVDGAGRVHTGKPVAANRAPLSSGYAAHTRNCNTDSIGIAVAAMAGAQERPFSAGRYPITEPQIEAFVRLAADLAREYGIPITRRTILSHAEVQPTLGIAQAGKWDIAWLPGMAGPADPVAVGDRLRAWIADAMLRKPGADPASAPPAAAAQPSPWAALVALVQSLINLARKGA